MSRHFLMLGLLLFAALGCGGTVSTSPKTGGSVPSTMPTKFDAATQPGVSTQPSAVSVEDVALTDEQKKRFDDKGFVVIAKDGSIVDATPVKTDGKAVPAVSADVCGISYVDCTDKQTYVVSLKQGETFIYGDWDGSKCVQKSYKCE